jgi:hypothetical protein
MRGPTSRRDIRESLILCSWNGNSWRSSHPVCHKTSAHCGGLRHNSRINASSIWLLFFRVAEPESTSSCSSHSQCSLGYSSSGCSDAEKRWSPSCSDLSPISCCSSSFLCLLRRGSIPKASSNASSNAAPTVIQLKFSK